MSNTKALFSIWLATAAGVVAFVAGFNLAVDPFGYFGTNRIGYFFSSERQFKYNLVRTNDYNALLLGDSRIAYTDASLIKIPGYRFVNGGIGGASFAEQVNLLKTARLDKLKLVIVGLNYSDLGGCSQAEARVSGAAATWDPLRFAASWTQLGYSLRALSLRTKGANPAYHADGSRSVTDTALGEARLDGKTKRYWGKIEEITSQTPTLGDFNIDPTCAALLTESRKLADQKGFDLVLVFLPRNSDLLRSLPWETPPYRTMIEDFVSKRAGARSARGGSVGQQVQRK